MVDGDVAVGSAPRKAIVVARAPPPRRFVRRARPPGLHRCHHRTLVPGEGRRLSAARRCGKHGPVRGYCIRGRILGDDDDE
jgi:hypothetical protein